MHKKQEVNFSRFLGVEWTSGVNFRLPVPTLTHFYSFRNGLFFAIAYSALEGKWSEKASYFAHKLARGREFSDNSLPWLLPPTAEFCRRTGRVRVASIRSVSRCRSDYSCSSKCKRSKAAEIIHRSTRVTDIPRPLVKLYANKGLMDEFVELIQFGIHVKNISTFVYYSLFYFSEFCWKNSRKNWVRLRSEAIATLILRHSLWLNDTKIALQMTSCLLITVQIS